jgi:pyruvate dehydrogenase E1 component alpha subunit
VSTLSSKNIEEIPQFKQIIVPDGSVKKDLVPKVSNKELVRWYRVMVTVRVLDEKAMRLQRQGRIGFNVPTTGQEAHVAAAAALKDTDWIFPAYREHGAALYRGLPLRTIVNHYFGNNDDPQRGRRLPGLFGSRDQRFVNPSAPIGTQIIHAVGAAYAAKYLKDGTVTMVFFGDGATSSNDFHSGMNFAKVFDVPCILICQNNQYAISLPVKRQTKAKNLVDKAIGYGMPGIQVDGNDVFAVYSAVSEAAKRARKGKGPTFIESVTYRLGAHSSSDDPTRYRSKEEVEEWKARDPIKRFRTYLISQAILTEEESKQIDADIVDTLNQLVMEAETVEKPPIETMFTDVYEEMPWHLKEQLDELRRIMGGGK